MLPRLRLLLGFMLSWRRFASVSTDSATELDAAVNSVIPGDYNGQRPPDSVKDKSINVSFLLFSVSQVVFSKMEFEVDYLFKASWSDERFNTEHFKTSEEAKKLHAFEVPANAAERIWIPKIVFTECKRCDLGLLTGQKFQLIYSWRDNLLTTYHRDTRTFACMFDLSFYPFDEHRCNINIYLMEPLSTINLKMTNVLVFNVQPEKFLAAGMPPEFQLMDVSVGTECSDRCAAHNTTPTSCLQYGVRFKRIPHYHLMLVYSPTITIVLISWISFWLPVDSTAPRVSLGMTSLLTLTTQFANAQKDLPPVSYLKALDVWMMMCSCMVFLSLLEFTLANIFKNPKRVQEHPVITVKDDPGGNLQTPHSGGRIMRAAYEAATAKKPSPSKTAPTARKEVHWLDSKARIVFPVAFLIFNIIYWPCFARGG